MIRFVALAIAAVLVGIDQLIKIRVLEGLAHMGSVEVVPSLFYLTYVENRGAAFGILQDKTSLLSVVTAVVLLAILYIILSGRVEGRFFNFCLALIVAGGAGNLIDRIRIGFVVDYLDFSALFGFPVFNFADCCVVVGTILLLIGILWSDKQVSRQTEQEPPAAETETE